MGTRCNCMGCKQCRGKDIIDNAMHDVKNNIIDLNGGGMYFI
jgi:hypothetical protein